MDIEERYVKKVYSEIASHFSQTRFCIWNFVRNFLENKTPNMKGIEIGCGNGKNMLINSSLDIIGTDICAELLEICVTKNLNVVQNDCCRMYFKDNIFDYALAVAVFHHMADTSRRNQALSEMIRILKVGGHGIFSVWSIENQEKKRHFTPGDNFVKWERRCDRKIFERYYYVFTRDMLDDLLNVFSRKIFINRIFNERGNWIVDFTKI